MEPAWLFRMIRGRFAQVQELLAYESLEARAGALGHHLCQACDAQLPGFLHPGIFGEDIPGVS